ncbi:PAN-like domain-containing protein [Cladophialophora immunda]|nr:PAN-like domain-containing protein [Cladophialophora immunda]
MPEHPRWRLCCDLQCGSIGHFNHLILGFLVSWYYCRLSGNHIDGFCHSNYHVELLFFFTFSVEFNNFSKCGNNEFHRADFDNVNRAEYDNDCLLCLSVKYKRRRFDRIHRHRCHHVDGDELDYFHSQQCRQLHHSQFDGVKYLYDELDGTNYILVDDIGRVFSGIFGIHHHYCASHDSFDDDYGPNYSALALAVTLSTVAAGATGTLCAGANVSPGASQPLPVATGAYNYQKVALADFPSTIYEVECWMNAGSTGGTVTQQSGTYYSLESCIDACTAAGTSTCLVAYWASQTRVCYLYNRVNSGGSPSLAGGQSPAKIVGSGVRTARLLTGQPVPNVVDATYLLAPGYDLGLCNNNNYQLTFVGVYYNGASGTGPATINVNRDNIWYVSCGASFQNSQSGIQLSPVYSLATPVFGFTSPPATADDCARICQSYHSSFLLSGGTDCNLWQFVPSAVNQCQLWPSNAGVANGASPGTTRDAGSNTIFAAGLLRGNSGTEFSSQAQYKKRALPAGMDYSRRHARDSLINDDSIPDVVLKFDKGTGNWTEMM